MEMFSAILDGFSNLKFLRLKNFFLPHHFSLEDYDEVSGHNERLTNLWLIVIHDHFPNAACLSVNHIGQSSEWALRAWRSRPRFGVMPICRHASAREV